MTRSTFALPVAIALLSLLGLILALTGDGWRDLLSWAGLSAPALAVLWAVALRTR
jgi:hypothetical protein